jgi:hypothetical protein
MIKKVTLFMPDGGKREFVAPEWAIAIDGAKVVVRNASVPRKEFVGIPFEADHARAPDKNASETDDD